MNRRMMAMVIGLLTALTLGLGACDSKKSNDDKSAEADKEASKEKKDEKKEKEEEKADKEEAAEPTPDERLDYLQDKEVQKAKEAITADNADKMAEQLQKEIEGDLGGDEEGK